VNPAYFFYSGFGEKRKTFTMQEIDEIILRKKRMNILQVAQYAIELKKPKICLVFFSRDLSYGIKVHQWDGIASEWVAEVAKEKADLLHYWMKDELPPAIGRLYDGQEGKYCPFYNKAKGECQKGGNCVTKK